MGRWEAVLISDCCIVSGGSLSRDREKEW